jgi:large subunit ribosomal protein L24
MLGLKKNDHVIVTTGSQKGKTGKIIKIDRDTMRVWIEGVNMRIKHVKPSQANPQGGRISVEQSIHYSNVMLMDKNGKPTRFGVKTFSENGVTKSVRYAKSTGEVI